MRFGIGMNTDHTLEEVGQQFSRHPRAHPPDRGEGAQEAQASEPLAEAQELPGSVGVRVEQPFGSRGSLKWLQRAIANRPDLLRPRGLPEIVWRSPLAEDSFAEYRDAAFLDRLGLGRLTLGLAAFWPRRGPQWDALGTTVAGPVLVEAKAHLREFFSPGTQARGASQERITAAFAAVRADLGVPADTDWCRQFYQYTNRLAHLWWLRQHGVAAELLFVSFIGDGDMDGPRHAETWQAAFDTADYALGLPRRHALSQHVHHVMPDVSLLAEPAS